jgi:hypothetical protein
LSRSIKVAVAGVTTRGWPGIKRWVGLGVIADNMINIGLHLAGTR